MAIIVLLEMTTTMTILRETRNNHNDNNYAHDDHTNGSIEWFVGRQNDLMAQLQAKKQQQQGGGGPLGSVLA